MQVPLLHLALPGRYRGLMATGRKRIDPRAELGAVKAFFRAWGSQGGKKGGKARWKGVSAEERRAHARKAAQARWARVKKT